MCALQASKPIHTGYHKARAHLYLYWAEFGFMGYQQAKIYVGRWRHFLHGKFVWHIFSCQLCLHLYGMVQTSRKLKTYPNRKINVQHKVYCRSTYTEHEFQLYNICTTQLGWILSSVACCRSTQNSLRVWTDLNLQSIQRLLEMLYSYTYMYIIDMKTKTGYFLR
jgi:hypothetical protein